MFAQDLPAAPLTLTGPLTIETVAELRATLLAALQHPHNLCCDLAAVDACDTAGVQLLCAAAASAAFAGRTFQVVAASAAVRAAVARIGVNAAAIGLHDAAAETAGDSADVAEGAPGADQ